MHTLRLCFAAALVALCVAPVALSQGVTTATLVGTVSDADGEPLPGANVVAVHTPSGTTYGAASRADGRFDLPNLRIGGPYTVTASFVGYASDVIEGLDLRLGEATEVSLVLRAADAELGEVTVRVDPVFNADRTGAETTVGIAAIESMPTISRSTRDLTRLDPRSDGNFSYAGRNWLFNNVTLDGSYFNNPFGLDDPAPGGQAGAEPVPYDAIAQVQVSLAPFDVREGGFTGANVNQVTRSGTNEFEGTAYLFYRDENLLGNSVSGNTVLADPSLSFNQIGLSAAGPVVRDRLFFFVNGELSRRDDPGTNFVANRGEPAGTFGVSRVTAEDLEAISNRLRDAYGYETGAFDGWLRSTDSNKLLVKLDWNISQGHAASFRWNYLDAYRDLPVNPTAIAFANAGRGPNEVSLPFQNSGYRINNELNSFAAELNSRGTRYANRFFASYNRFRDFREPFSEDFPTIEIVEDGVTYTTAGHEPFSIHNILDQDVLQFTNNLSLFAGSHVVTVGANLEMFSFFNSFNLFRHGLFMLPWFLDFEGNQIPNGSTFFSVDEFLTVTNPDLPLCGSPDGQGGVYLLADAGVTCRVDLRGMVTPSASPFKGENIEVGQFALYVQDEFRPAEGLDLTIGLRVDLPFYGTDPVVNPFSTGLTALDENDNPETVDQADLPGASLLFSPRLGFNWDPQGDRSIQVRGGTGIFTGRVPFVWVGNVISNPGNNPNLYPNVPEEDVPDDHVTDDDAILQTSFDLNAMDDDFRFPQVWTTDLAVDHRLPGGTVLTLEGIYSKDINAVFMRNADLGLPVRTLADGRPYFGGAGNNELNPDGGAGIYVIDNSGEGSSFNITAQARHAFANGLSLSGAYSYTYAENLLNSTEIASVLWTGNPVQGDPNQPGLAPSQFGQPHRLLGTAFYRRVWSSAAATSIGLFATLAQGNAFIYAGGNRYSFLYSGDVNGDGSGGNDLIYVPEDAGDIRLSETDANGEFFGTVEEQWAALNAFIEQDDYLSSRRGQIVERFGAVNPWYSNIDVRLLQDLSFLVGRRSNTLQLSLDIQNFANLLSSDWGVRRVANPAATSPLTLVGFDKDGEPLFNFTGPAETFVDDPSEWSRWRMQVGLRYMLN
jgi:hypothetical protein